MRDLAAAAAVFLASHPDGLTVPEIAKGIHARAADVRETLTHDDRFSGPLPLAGRSPKAQGWRLAIFNPDESGRIAAGVEA